MREVEKCCRAEQTTEDNMVHSSCMLDSLGYKHTLRLCNTYCFPTATMVARTRVNITSFVHCFHFSVCDATVQLRPRPLIVEVSI